MTSCCIIELFKNHFAVSRLHGTNLHQDWKRGLEEWSLESNVSNLSGRENKLENLRTARMRLCIRQSSLNNKSANAFVSILMPVTTHCLEALPKYKMPISSNPTIKIFTNRSMSHEEGLQPPSFDGLSLKRTPLPRRLTLLLPLSSVYTASRQLRKSLNFIRTTITCSSFPTG